MLKRSPVNSNTSRGIQRAALIFAALFTVFAATSAGPPWFTNASRPVDGISNPLVSLPLARTADDVDAILGENPSPDREVVRIKLNIGLALAASYLGLFVILAGALAQLGDRRKLGDGRQDRLSYLRPWLAWAMSSFAILTVASDLRENRALRRLIDTNLASITPQMLKAARFDSIAKWALAATAFLILGIFLVTARRRWIRFIGGIDLLAAVMGVWGAFDPRILSFTMIPMAAGLILSAVTLRFVTYESASRNPISRSVRSI